MVKYSTPIEPRYYWAKLIHPSQMPDGEDWRSVRWEVVSVDINDPNGSPGDREYLSVLVPGISPVQWVEDFVWGPRIPDFIKRSQVRNA